MVSFVVAAPTSGSGKTVLTMGLIAALTARGHTVHPAKVGPDYIDPAYLTAAAGHPAVNLDLWAMRPALVDALARRENLIVEGVMGLFDGPATGEGSTADVARRLQRPIVLAVSAERQSHSVAALVHGFTTFDPSLTIAGTILTKVASTRHEAMLRSALSAANLACLGALPRDAALNLDSRHLGLHQAGEHANLAALIETAATAVARHCDLAALERLGGPVAVEHLGGPAAVEHLGGPAALERPGGPAATAVAKHDGPAAMAAPCAPLPPLGQRIAIARDAAFTFAYPHILDGWHAAGATLHPFSPLAGEAPDPTADAIVLPGGYPELHAGALAAAPAWRNGLADAATRGALIYGECGGYMALGQTLIDANGTPHPMAGLLPVVTSFAARRRTLGYRRLTHRGGLFPAAARGHEFHYATEVSRADGLPPLFEAADTAGAPLGPIGLQRGRIAGSFAHVIDRTEPQPG